MTAERLDRRRQTIPGAPGLLRAPEGEPRPRVVVVGAGIAGLAAATGLAERGVAVDVVEQHGYLGGRVGGWPDVLADGSPAAMNRGFHAFFRQYYNLRELLRRSDSRLRALTPVEDYPLIDGAGRTDTFRGLPTTPPLNALVFALRSPTFTLRDLLGLDARAAAPLAAVSVPQTYELLDDRDAATFLRDINFPDAARHLAFEVFARSFFARPEALSAGELVTMFHIYFLGSSEGLIFDVANANFDVALWNPLRSYLEGLGARFHTGITVQTVSSGRGVTVTTTGPQFEADAVVLATDVAGLRSIVASSPSLGDGPWRDRVAAMGTAPPFVVLRLWLDRAVRSDRAPFVGTGGREPLDNVSVVDRYEAQAAQWAARTGGSVVELHAYSVSDEDSDDIVRKALLERMHELYPETVDATIVDERLLRHADCPRFAPGDFAGRPTVDTPDPRVVLAGDGIRVDAPVALMERAATTGWSAANQLLGGFGLAGHPLQTVPNRGRSALLRRLAGAAR